MALPALVDGALPLGRWSATPEEVEAAFVTGQSTTRQQIWADWLELTSALREVAGVVPAAWLSGSFVTDKADPGDVDSVYLIEWPILRTAHADPQRASFIEVVARSGAKELFGLSVDSFILEWWPRTGTKRVGWTRQYLEDRGYWDDLWSRQRSPDSRLDAMPRRGYVEVMLDGYA
jgi:hypothetical protein